MKNLKKVLALVLALATVMGLGITASAKEYTDASSIKYTEAVDFMGAINVLDGNPDGSFNPQGSLTRAQAAKMVAYIMNGGVDVNALYTSANTFTDCYSNWARGYIAFAAQTGIVSGVGNGKFNPNGEITGVALAKMMLTAIGYDAKVEGYVSNDSWQVNILNDARTAGLLKGLETVDMSKAITREQAAQLMYNAVNADMVEYEYQLTTVNGQLTSFAVAKPVQKNNSTVTLLSEKYEIQETEGFLYDASYNAEKKEYTYSIWNDADTDNTVDTGELLTYTTTNDFTSQYMMNVKALYKVENNGKVTTYGIANGGSDVLATGVLGDIKNYGSLSAATSIKVGDVEYKLDVASTAALNVYEQLDTNLSATDTLTTPSKGNLDAYDSAPATHTFKLIDRDGNGKADYMVVTPYTVQKVTYVGSKSITAGGSYTFEDNTVYEGVAKDDYVMIVAGTNTLDGGAKITKLETVEGTVTALKGTEIQINGTWYKKSAGTLPAVGNTVKLSVVGTYYFNVEVVDGKSLDNVLFVLDAGTFSEGLASGAEAKVMYAKDGTVATVKVSKVDGSAVDSASTSATYGTATDIKIGAMYTFVEKNGSLELTKLANNVIGTYSFAAGTGFDANGLNSTDPAIDTTYAIADSAVVMVYSNADDKAEFMTGAQLKAWKSDYGTYAQVLTSKVNGVETAQVVAIYSTATMGGVSSTTGYGYVVGDTYFITENNTPYAVMDIWTADGALTAVKAEGHDGSTNTAPTAALVTSEPEYQKGAFITYEKLPNGNIAKVDEVGSLTDYALYSSYVNKDGETVVGLDADGVVPAGATTANITKDTVVVYVDTDKVSGAEGGTVSIATETAISGVYVKNVKAVVSSGDITVLFVDVSNNLATNTDVATLNAIQGATAKVTTFTDNKISLTATGTITKASLNKENTASGVDAADDYNFTGMSISFNFAGATAAVGDTITVVAQDGTVNVYTFVA